ncbi:MAG: hypothetical protein EXS18_02995 [Verrucomicrobiae bacterium]|nr:hypothetical protein [Verrucomicrobiae bacterium]
MTSVTGVFERRRLENLKLANESISRCRSRVFVDGYKPGHVWYNLNEYPTDRFIEPTERDEKLLTEYAANGVEVIKVHEEWNDSLELHGADKFSAYDADGWREFIRLVHRHRLKIVPYVSSGFLDHRSKHFRLDWIASTSRLDEMYWRYAYMSPRSPGWRSFLLEKVDMILSHDGVDGIYNDMGFYPYAESRESIQAEQIDAFRDEPDHYGALEDFLGEIHSIVKRHRGIVMNHFGGSERPPCRQKFYDYLCIGEGVKGLEAMRDKAKHWEPFTLVIPDWTRLEGEESALYASCIPYLMFPILCGGRPVTGERASCPNVQYMEDVWFKHMKRIAELRKQSASPTYGWWDSAPGRPNVKPRWFHYLKLYRRMTEDCTQAFIEVTEGKLFGQKLPGGVVCSAFVNQDFWLAMANYGSKPVTIPLTINVEDMESGERAKVIELQPQTLRLLKKL